MNWYLKLFECLLIQNLVKIIYKKCSVFIKILCAGCVPPKNILMFSFNDSQIWVISVFSKCCSFWQVNLTFCTNYNKVLYLYLHYSQIFSCIIGKIYLREFLEKDRLFQDKLKISKINRTNLFIFVYFGNVYEGLLWN